MNFFFYSMIRIHHLLVLLLFSYTAAADEVMCHMTSEERNRIDALREAMAVVDLTVHPGDEATGINLGVIDTSCLTGTRASYKDQTILSIRNAINLAIERSQICFDRLRFREMPDVISVLGRTRFRCNDPTGDGLVASMRRTSRTYDACGRGLTRWMAGAHRRYEMTMSAPAAGLPDKLNSTASTNMETEELASFLAHEAMHVLAMNNREWHNTFDERERGTLGCGPSRFEDRIYFTQAACFPQSSLGRDFYSDGGAYQCAGLCNNALTGIDPEALIMYSASTEPGAEFTSAYGPSQAASPYPSEEAGRICERIRDWRDEVR